MIESTPDGNIIATGRQDVDMFRLMSLRAALRLECKGIKIRRRFSAYATIKREFNLRGNKQSVLEQFSKIVESDKAERLSLLAVAQ